MKICIVISMIVTSLVFASCSSSKPKTIIDKTPICQADLAEFSTHISKRGSTDELKKIVKAVKSAQENCSKGDVLIWMTERNLTHFDEGGMKVISPMGRDDELSFFTDFFYEVPKDVEPRWIKVFEEKGDLAWTVQNMRFGPGIPDARDRFIEYSQKYPLRKFPAKYR